MSNNLVVFDTNACSPSADNIFGPLLAGYCHGFDFTLLFEQGLLTLAPTLLFLILGPIRLIGLHKASIKTLPAVVGYAKFIGAGVLVALQLALVVLWAVNQPLQTRLSVPSAALSLVAAVVFLGLSYIEHARSVRPSTLLNSYLLFSLILDVAQVRTLFLRTSHLIGSIFVTTMGVKFVLLLLEARNKRAFLKQPHDRLPGETISGIFNRTLFWWLNPLFLDAFRNPIAFDNLPEIDTDLSSSHLGEVLEQLWQRRSKPESRFTLFWITHRALLRPLLSIIFPRMALIGFNFAQPFLINRVLSLLSDNQSSSADWTAYGLIAATGFTYLGIAISTLHFQHALYRFMSMVRGALVTLIYRQTLSSRCDQYDESSSLTLMSTDIDRIVACIQYVHAIWARTIEVGIGTTLLILQLGWVSVIPLVVVGLSSMGNSLVAKMIGSRQKRWMQAIQRRVAITGSILTSMKSIKMMGLTETVSRTIQNQRIRETKHQASYRWMIVWLNLIANFPQGLAPVATFAAFALLSSNSDSSGLSITKAFTVLSIITLTTGPAAYLLSAIPSAASALGSYDRVQNFLLAPSREDQRIVRKTMQRSGVNKEAQGPLSSNKEGVSHGEEDVDLHQWGSSAIVVRDATVRPASDARPVIKNICFSVDRGSIFTIMGPVGAGKTTLVKSLLGELSCDSGDVCVFSTKISYCAQHPWLSNCTIKQNICGPEDPSSPIDEKWYSTVIQACALNIDMSRLPHGDQTIAGSKGTTLSGGQKQRVALARALYSRNDIFIFDDVFSALDISTQRTIFEGIFGGNGILRKLGSTAIVVTHTTRFLPFSDQIIILDANGNAVQSGTYSVLRQQTDSLQNIELQSQLNSHNAPQEVSHNPNQGATSDVSIQEQPPNFAAEAENVAIYRYYLRSVGWFRGAVFAGFAAVAVFGNSFSQVWLNWWVKANGDQLGKHIAVYFVLSMIEIIGQGACNWAILVMIASSTARKLHLALLKTVMRAPQSFFDKTDPGSLLNRFSQDMTLIETPLSVGALFTVFNGFTVIAQAGLIVSGSYYMTATLPFLLIVIFLLQKFYLRTSRQLQVLDLEARSPLYSHFLNTIDGTITVRAFGWQEHFKNANIKHVDYSQRPYYLLYCIQRWLNLVLDLIIAAMAILVVTLSLNLRGTVNPGLLGISLNNILAFNTNLQSFITGWTQLETSLSAVARVRHLEASTEREDKSTESREPPCNWPQRGSIVMKNLTAGYNSSTPTFRNVNLTILPGQKVGICGRTGSGKSTLLSTVLRLINPMSGDILVDDISLLTLPHDITRARLLTIPQDGLILPGSVRFNVDPTGHYSDSAIIRALEKVQLWPILPANRSSLPGSHTVDNDAEGNFNDALEAPLHEKSLSAGQVQLLALARVLLRKDQSSILLLDEATSSVDVDTEKRMWNILRSEFRDHTILHIAHRLDTLLDADLVAVMDQGELVEVGEPGALLRGEVGTGVFKQLVGR